jgi:Ribbon-helix-helix domain
MPGPRRATTRACLTLRSTQLDALRDLSRATGAPVAELTRRAVDSFLADRVLGYTPGLGHPASFADPTAVRTQPR